MSLYFFDFLRLHACEVNDILTPWQFGETDPFILLHEFGPMKEAMKMPPVGMHPHRGFNEVTEAICSGGTIADVLFFRVVEWFGRFCGEREVVGSKLRQQISCCCRLLYQTRASRCRI